MSLTDALLLEPYRDAREVWIALRSDGQCGSGTQSDPYDGSATTSPAFFVTSLTRVGKEATAVTSQPHGFLVGDMITISGVTNNIYFSGTFQIHEASASSFKYWMLDTPDAGSAAGTITCWRERERFDALMRTIGPNTQVHLGPGVFETKGYAPSVAGMPAGQPAASGAWNVQSGQKISGSGMGITTLKLVNISFPEHAAWAIGSDHFLDGFEVCDLTVDCNVSGQLNQYVTCGAVRVTGRHVRVRRIRAIHFGAQTLTYVENFVVVPAQAYPDYDAQGLQVSDCVVEDCIAERPGANPVQNSVCFHLGAGETRHDGVTSYHRDCVIRNCLVDGRIVYGSAVPVPIASISYAGGVVSVTTKAPHLLTCPGNVIISGVTVNGGYGDNLFNGVFAIESLDPVDPSHKFTFLHTTGETPDPSNGWVGGGVSSHRTNICTLEKVDEDNPDDWRFKITTGEPHFRTTNNNVRIYGILKPDPLDPAKLIPSTAFNGTFAVDAYNPKYPEELQFTLLSAPDPDLESLDDLDLTGAFANVGHQALSAGGGFGTVVEGNRIYHCSVGGPYHDTYSSGDLIVRNNYYHDVLDGPFENFTGRISSGQTRISLDSLVHQGNTAIATTSLPHGFRVGDLVTISGVTGADASLYDGDWKITAVPSAKEFRYQMSDTPGADAPEGAGYATYEEVVVPDGRTIAVSHQVRLTGFERVENSTRVFGRVIALFKHGLLVGDAVRVTKAGAFENGEFPPFELFHGYSGVFRVTKIVDEQTFEYEFTDAEGSPYDPGSPGDDFSAGYFGRLWQVRRLVIENNFIELPVRYYSGYGPLTGIPIYGDRVFLPEYTVREVIIRGNVIRNSNDQMPSHNFALNVSGCGRLWIEGNIIGSALPMLHGTIGSVKTFNNLRPNGQLVRSYAGSVSAPEVVTQVRADLEDAIVASFLGI
jgi:hypothetical protein